MCAVGGDVMALVHDGAAHAVNGSGRAPRAAPAGKYPVPRSVDAITVPGAVSAWQTIAERWGIRPSGRRAERGGRAGPRRRPVARSLAGALEEPAGCDGRRGALKVFAPEGRLLRRVRHACAAAARRNAGAARQRTAPRTSTWAGPAARSWPAWPRWAARSRWTISRPPHRHRAGPARSVLDRDLYTMGANSQGFCLLQIMAGVERMRLDDPLGEQAPVLAALFRESARRPRRATSPIRRP